MRSVMGYWDPERPEEPKDYKVPRCPVCGEDCEAIYLIGTEIIGCDMCYNPDDFPGEDVQEDDPWEDCRCMEDY